MSVNEWKQFCDKPSKTELELEMLRVCNRSGRNPYELIELLRKCGFLESDKHSTANDILKCAFTWIEDEEESK